jgi:arsenate reductase-like glutaredoxin family protein
VTACVDRIVPVDRRTEITDLGFGKYRTVYTKLAIYIYAKYNDNVVAARWVKSQDEIKYWEDFCTDSTCIRIAQTKVLNAWVQQNWTSGKSLRTLFENQSQELPIISKALMVVLLNQATAQVEEELRNHQIYLYSKILTSSAELGELLDALEQMSGVKELLKSYVALGLARSLEENDYLKSLLLGNQSLIERNAVVAAYNAALIALNEGQQVPKVDISPIVEKRVEALAGMQGEPLSGVLGEIFEQIDLGEFAEIQHAVDITLAKLRLRKGATESLAGNDFYSTEENTLLVVSEAGVLNNDIQARRNQSQCHP